MSARDVMIFAGLPHYSEGGCMGLGEHERRDVVESIIDATLSALTSSGYRILGPDEIDAVTVDVVARVIGVLAEQMKSADRFLKPEGIEELASAIRALCATHQGVKSE